LRAPTKWRHACFRLALQREYRDDERIQRKELVKIARARLARDGSRRHVDDVRVTRAGVFRAGDERREATPLHGCGRLDGLRRPGTRWGRPPTHLVHRGIRRYTLPVSTAAAGESSGSVRILYAWAQTMAGHNVDVTQVLAESQAADPAGVAEKLLPVVYDELRELARRYLRAERGGHTLQPTALVHEAFLRLVDQSRVDWKGRTHFFAVSAAAMRRILIDNARARRSIKRGGGWHRVLLDDAASPEASTEVDAVVLHHALEKLASLDEEQARIVELRFFGGMTVEEVAHVLGVSKRKVEADWTHAKAWLRSEISSAAQP